MSICAHAQAGYRIRALHDEVGTTFLADGRRGGQRDWPFATYVFAERSAQTSAERSPRLPTLRKKKQRSQPTVESQESDRRTRKSSKVESTYWRFFTSQVFRLTLHVTVVLYCSLGSHYTKRATPDTCAARPIRAWHLEWREASYACVLLV